MPSVASCSQKLLVATPGTFSPDTRWPLTSMFNLFTHKKLNSYIHSDPAAPVQSLVVIQWPVFIQSSSIFPLPVNPTSAVLTSTEQPVCCSLGVPKWQRTETDTALPVISPAGLLRLTWLDATQRETSTQLAKSKKIDQAIKCTEMKKLVSFSGNLLHKPRVVYLQLLSLNSNENLRWTLVVKSNSVSDSPFEGSWDKKNHLKDS